MDWMFDPENRIGSCLNDDILQEYGRVGRWMRSAVRICDDSMHRMQNPCTLCMNMTGCPGNRNFAVCEWLQGRLRPIHSCLIQL